MPQPGERLERAKASLRIPHGCDRATYDTLLQGKWPEGLEGRACHRRRLALADDAGGPSEASLTEVAEGFGPLAGPPAEDEEGQESADEVEQKPGDPQPGSADHEENADAASDADSLSEALGAIMDQEGIVVASLGVGAGSSVEVARSRPAAAQEAARPLSDVGQAFLEPSYWGALAYRTQAVAHVSSARWVPGSVPLACKEF